MAQWLAGVDGGRRLLRGQDLGDVGHGLEIVDRSRSACSAIMSASSSRDRIAERDPDHEAVELRLGKGIGALVLDRVLGGDTRNGRASWWVTPSIVTRRSCMHSRRPDCVFGEARLISSTRTMFAKIGPGRKSKRASRWL